MNNMRYYINLIEGINKKDFVGTCVSSFDEDGFECIIPELPFNDVNDLGYVDENAEDISKEEFLSKVDVPESLLKQISGRDDEIRFMYYSPYDLYILYDEYVPNGKYRGHDIHYFFT